MTMLEESLKELLNKEPHEFETEEELAAAVKGCREARAKVGRDRQLQSSGAKASRTSTGKAKKESVKDVQAGFDALEDMIAKAQAKKEGADEK